MKAKPTKKAPRLTVDPIEVKVALLRKGTTLQRWAHAHGYLQPTVWYAVHKLHQGPKSRRILTMLKQELGV